MPLNPANPSVLRKLSELSLVTWWRAERAQKKIGCFALGWFKKGVRKRWETGKWGNWGNDENLTVLSCKGEVEKHRCLWVKDTLDMVGSINHTPITSMLPGLFSWYAAGPQPALLVLISFVDSGWLSSTETSIKVCVPHSSLVCSGRLSSGNLRGRHPATAKTLPPLRPCHWH